MSNINYEDMDIVKLIDEIRKAKKRQHKAVYREELHKYITSKLEQYDVPTYIIMEIALYAAVGTELLINEEAEKIYYHLKYEDRRTKRNQYSKLAEGKYIEGE